MILGVTVMTLGLVGMYRMPDVYTKSHAASKSVFLGVNGARFGRGCAR